MPDKTEQENSGGTEKTVEGAQNNIVASECVQGGTEQKPNEPHQKKEAQAESKDSGWSTGNLIILCVIISLLSSASSLFVYDKYFATKVAAIDLKGYIDEQRNLFAEGKLGPDDLKKKIDHLEAVVMQVPKNKVILMGDTVVRNVEVIKP